MEEKDLLQNSCGGFPYPVTTQGELESFSCGDKDLDDFFHQDAFLYLDDSQKESLKAGVVGYASSKLWKDGKD